MSNLPKEFFNFWYSNSLYLFIRVWTNTINILEEDLAVSLMWRLLFVPLFHDSSIIGRSLSFIFRTTRIFLGLFAYGFASFFIFTLALLWFSLPILFFIPSFTPFALAAKALFLLGVFLFTYLKLTYPEKTLKQAIIEQILAATKLKKEDLTWDKLIQEKEVQELIWQLELSKDFSLPTTPLSNEYFDMVWSLAKQNNPKYITPAYFWIAMIINTPLIETNLLKLNLQINDFKKALLFFEDKRKKQSLVLIWDDDFAVTHLKGVNRGWLGAPTPVLDSVSIDLTKESSRAKFSEFVGREKIVSEVINILSQENNQNVLLVGPPGAGKSSLVLSLASRIIAGDAPASLATKRLVALDLSKLLSDVTTQGDLATKIKIIFDEIRFVQNIIIYVDEIQNLGLGDVGANFNLYSLIQTELESNQFQFLASTEPENYAKIIEKNSSFARVFTKIELPPATIDETFKIIQQDVIDMEKYHKIKVSFIALKDFVEFSSKYIHDRVLPDSAIALLNEASSIAKNGEITSQIVKEVLSQRVNVPIAEVDSVQKQELLNLEDRIHQKMVDQEEAVKAVADTLRRGVVSLRETNRPIGSFLFVGPTGVGKTELAKTLAELYFKNECIFYRFDMSEYQTEDSIKRLIGDENNPGELTEKVKSKPYCLILFDEFEKASHNILNLFLQVLDDGRLTEGSGKTIDFTNTIIIATSNAGSLLIAQGLGKGQPLSQIETQVKEELLKIYKPELVNRFDSIVLFKPLSEADLEKIVYLKLADLTKMLKEQGYLIEFTPDLITLLAKKGFDQTLGARPLRRLIQDTIEAKLSRMILENKLTKGEIFEADPTLLT